MAKIAGEILWEAQSKQAAALACPYDELFYGGAKFGGKSDFLIMDFWQHAKKYTKAGRGILFRRSYNELEEIITRTKELYCFDAVYSETKKTWTFVNGAVLKLRFLESDSDVGRYQGHSYSWIGFDELTEFPTAYCYIFMISCLRSPGGAKCYLRASGNPGRIGHLWVRSRFIDPAPPMSPIVDTFKLQDGSTKSMTRVFIPASLEDNKKGTENDPLYEVRLELLKEGQEHLYKAFRFGDWDVISGAAFGELRRSIHSIDVNNPPDRLHRVFDFERMTPKEGVNIFRAMDWGYAKPFSVGWYFADYEGRVYRYREMYGCKGANEGISMPAREVAQKIKQIEVEHKEKISLSIADASIWDKPGNQNERAEKLPSIAETMQEEGIYFDRLTSIFAKKSRIQGKHQLHERFRIDADGLPALMIFSSCVHWWRTVPVLPLDTFCPEDIDTAAEDHCYDETRYLCSARPYKSTIASNPPPPLSMPWLMAYKNRFNAPARRPI